jgi:ABC-type antimicrobial peptide transport system permease subunit
MMILKNLLLRKGRTLLTILGIGLGVAAIIGLGAMADGLEAGYSSMLGDAQADLVLSQPDALDVSYSSLDEAIGAQLQSMSEVKDISPMLEGFVQTEGLPYFFVFGYPQGSFLLERFRMIQGVSIFSRQAQQSKGKPVMIGSAAAESLHKAPGDVLRMTDSVYRVVGIYQTGDAFEDSGAVLELASAQALLGKPRQVSLFFIQLKDPALRSRLEQRMQRLWPDLSLGGTGEFADEQMMADALRGYVWAIAGLAIVIGGVGMMNAQLMSISERTGEIGVLRAVGWGRWRVLGLILGESILVSMAGGAMGVGLGWLVLKAFSGVLGAFGASASGIRPGLILQAACVVIILGLFGGLYPAWRASKLAPVDALRYEGGSSSSNVRRLPFGGMAVQSLAQRTTRTLLTLGGIALTIGAIITMEGVMDGAADDLTGLAIASDSEIIIRQANIADTSLSALDESIGERIAAMPKVQSVSGMVMTALMLPEGGGFFVLQGYSPSQPAIQHFRIVEGKQLAANHQIIIGRLMSEAISRDVGDTLELGGARLHVVGVYETGVSWEELGGVVTLREAQTFAGRPRKVTLFAVKARNPADAPLLVDEITRRFPEAHAALTGDFVDQMPDMQNGTAMINAVSLLAIMVGGVGVLNTMLMAVIERTREIGVLRALGWKRRSILALIMREALLLGVLGGAAGILVAIGLVGLLEAAPMIGEIITFQWSVPTVVRAVGVAASLGTLGGLYPAYRAARMQPVEALRYE